MKNRYKKINFFGFPNFFSFVWIDHHAFEWLSQISVSDLGTALANSPSWSSQRFWRSAIILCTNRQFSESSESLTFSSWGWIDPLTTTPLKCTAKTISLSRKNFGIKVLGGKERHSLQSFPLFLLTYCHLLGLANFLCFFKYFLTARRRMATIMTDAPRNKLQLNRPYCGPWFIWDRIGSTTELQPMIC